MYISRSQGTSLLNVEWVSLPAEGSKEPAWYQYHGLLRCLRAPLNREHMQEGMEDYLNHCHHEAKAEFPVALGMQLKLVEAGENACCLTVHLTIQVTMGGSLVTASS